MRVLSVPGNRCKHTYREVASCHGRQFPAKGKPPKGLTARRRGPGLQNKILQTVTNVERYQGLTGSDKNIRQGSAAMENSAWRHIHGSFHIRGRKDMQNKRKVFLAVLTMILLGILASPLSVFAAEAEETAQPALYATFWALIPPVVAIALALITRRYTALCFWEFW